LITSLQNSFNRQNLENAKISISIIRSFLVFRQLIADSSSAPLLRYVIQLSTLIQQTTGLDGSSAKKVF
jgi:hypothetical protein